MTELVPVSTRVSYIQPQHPFIIRRAQQDAFISEPPQLTQNAPTAQA